MSSSRLSPLLVALALVAAACGSSASGADEDSGPDVEVAAETPVQAALGPSIASDEMSVSTVDPAVLDPAPSNGAAEVAPRTVSPLEPPLEPVGTSSGPATARAQERLIELGFWVSEASGTYGITTTQAVMAFQKYSGLATDGVLGPVTAAAISEVTERPSGRSTKGTLVEVDKSKQLVFLIRNGVTEWILNTSTGSEIPYEEADQNTPDEIQIGDSVTRAGLFEVYREREEGWWEGDLGEIYRPKYFNWGIALHGANNVPNYPASHGCVRLSIPAMDWIWEEDLVPMGTPVWVHGEIPEEFRYDPDVDTEADG